MTVHTLWISSFIRFFTSFYLLHFQTDTFNAIAGHNGDIIEQYDVKKRQFSKKTKHVLSKKKKRKKNVAHLRKQLQDVLWDMHSNLQLHSIVKNTCKASSCLVSSTSKCRLWTGMQFILFQKQFSFCVVKFYLSI